MRFVIHIQAHRHAEYLRGKPIDPVAHEQIRNGDQVVVCAVCKSVFLLPTWEYFGSTHCGQAKTLPQLPPPRVVRGLGHEKGARKSQPIIPPPIIPPRPSQFFTPTQSSHTPRSPGPAQRQPIGMASTEKRLKIAKKDLPVTPSQATYRVYIFIFILLLVLLLLVLI